MATHDANIPSGSLIEKPQESLASASAPLQQAEQAPRWEDPACELEPSEMEVGPSQRIEEYNNRHDEESGSLLEQLPFFHQEDTGPE